MSADLDLYLRSWRLQPDGAPFETPSSRLCPVQSAEGPAVLKVLKAGSDETVSAAMLRWYGGDCAVRLLRAEGPALLLERASGSRSLAAMVRAGDDASATEILGGVLARLLTPRAGPPPARLEPLECRFAALLEAGDPAPAVATARALLAAPLDARVLHGDLHHENVLDGGPRGWLAIDPKGLLGERSYDAANILCNPLSASALVLKAERFIRQSKYLSGILHTDPERLLAFAYAHAGLALCWSLTDGTDPAHWLGCLAVLGTLVGKIAP